MASINPVSKLSASIASGASLSGAIDCGVGRFPRAIMADSAAEGSAFSFQASIDGTNYYNVNDDLGNEVSVAFTAGEWTILDPSMFSGFRYWKVRTGSSAAATNQVTAAATITLSIGAL